MSIVASVLTDYLVGKSIDMLPKWLVKRLMPPERVTAQLRIDLRGEGPVRYQQTTVPVVHILFEIHNNSPVDVTLDRLLVHVTFVTGILDTYDLERRVVPKKGGKLDLTLRAYLTNEQLAAFERGMSQSVAQLLVDVLAYFESDVGLITVSRRGGEQIVRTKQSIIGPA